MDREIVFYGTTRCGGSSRAKKVLLQRGISYRWVDIDLDPEGRAEVERINNGYRSVPTIVFPDGEILVEPTLAELEQKISTLKP